MHISTYVYFGLLTLAMLLLDVWQTRNGNITIKKAAIWSLFWVALALLFFVSLYELWNVFEPDSTYSAHDAATAFLTGYLLEKSLSVDNLFVFALIFGRFAVPHELRPRVLLWGVIGALILRAVMIAIGAELLHTFHWVLYLFAFFLIWTGYQLSKPEKEEEEEVSSFPERLVRKLFRVTDNYQGTKLFTRDNLGFMVTPLLVVVAVIAMTDVMFALDSIPAIFAVTQEPFLVLTANVFALLGLRSLYFVLEGMIDKFVYLRPALAFIMTFIGVKMLLIDTEWAIPTMVSLSVLLTTMTVAVIASIIKEKNAAKKQQA
ncbi:TerC/Alx family metal homeostasis membrane protein [Vibrio aphrogenes]|uniref:TerC/Alx family metal homeostasis membrane protein n=1 Tax=Vibrio aphrogenes TaxID=1891186 RepID=UPI000B3525CF|nr:TerC/Alx family metal homeostasis membrane protein [Vibrio aphrogenes]